MNPIQLAMWHFSSKHGVKSVDEIEPAESRGYWRFKRVCNGECGMGHLRAMQHTIHFSEFGERDKLGRFIDPYRAWRAWRDILAMRPLYDEDGL